MQDNYLYAQAFEKAANMQAYEMLQQQHEKTAVLEPEYQNDGTGALMGVGTVGGGMLGGLGNLIAGSRSRGALSRLVRGGFGGALAGAGLATLLKALPHLAGGVRSGIEAAPHAVRGAGMALGEAGRGAGGALSRSWDELRGVGGQTVRELGDIGSATRGAW